MVEGYPSPKNLPDLFRENALYGRMVDNGIGSTGSQLELNDDVSRIVLFFVTMNSRILGW